ncbi:hypothetical protein PQI66_06485 [Corynebacterium sp. USCH3]|uniref:hypothetical protein n=1 Tax=Corynebacterium sp. USCH3 TaxID=3024840 RepID=UPI00309F3B4D
MTVSRKWRRAVLAGAVAPVLVLAGCSTGDAGSGTDGQDSTDAEQADGDEGADGADGDTGTTGAGSTRVAERDLDGAPEGFRPTEPGTELDLGDAAYVITHGNPGNPGNPGNSGDDRGPGDEPGPLQYWKVTATGTEELGADEVALTEGGDDVETFVCLTYEIEFLGGDEGREDGAEGALVAPDLVPADDAGTGANKIERADPQVCGVEEDDRLPADRADVEEGTAYRGAVLSYVDKEKTRGISPTGLAFTYELDDLETDSDPSDSGDSGDADGTGVEPVHWS